MRIDCSKPVWRVHGRAEGTKKTVFVNASTEKEALLRARQEVDFAPVESIWQVDPLSGKPVSGLNIFAEHQKECSLCREHPEGPCRLGVAAIARENAKTPSPQAVTSLAVN
jgi:hypothetical protein